MKTSMIPKDRKQKEVENTNNIKDRHLLAFQMTMNLKKK